MKCAPLILLLAGVAVSSARATTPNAADGPMHQFLAQDDTQPSYRATRRLMAENGGRTGWLESTTYLFEPGGIDTEGLANVRLTPLREDRVLVAGIDVSTAGRRRSREASGSAREESVLLFDSSARPVFE